MMRSVPELRRVAVTGLGLVSTLGADLAASLASLGDGKKAETVDWEGAAVCPVAASFDPRGYFRVTKSLKLADRKTLFAVAAARMAQRDSGIPDGDPSLENGAVILGTGGSDLLMDEISRALAPDLAAESGNGHPLLFRTDCGRSESPLAADDLAQYGQRARGDPSRRLRAEQYDHDRLHRRRPGNRGECPDDSRR